MKTLINSKITKGIIRSYVFDDNFKADDHNLTPDDMNYLYKTVEGVDNSNELWEKIKKSHKKYYSEKDKTVFVNMVYDNIVTGTEFRVITNNKVKYFDSYQKAYDYYCNQCAEYFTDFEQSEAQMNLETKDNKNSVKLEIIEE